MASLDDLTARIRAFAAARDWQTFHTPKNLAMAIAGEAGELAAELQWLDGEASRTAVIDDAGLRERVSQEIADVLIYLVRLADVAQIDLLEAANAKVAINETRFPSSGSTT
jgi:NTP pyrophosphatase (non-canonical NTP hydrolase)